MDRIPRLNVLPTCFFLAAFAQARNVTVAGAARFVETESRRCGREAQTEILSHACN
jgi:hypothetical protein